MEKNEWVEELKKCIKKEVRVTDFFGKEYIGVCKSINYNYLNVVLMTKEEKIIIKNPQVIIRDRTK